MSARVRDHKADYAYKAARLRNPDKWPVIMIPLIRHRAKKKGLAFDLIADDIVVPERCPILGIPIVIGEGLWAGSPSVDRIDNKLGYIKGNVRVISARANSLKSNATIEELRAVLADMERERDKYPKLIHINRQHLAMNAKDGGNRPIITMKYRGTTRYAREARMAGPTLLKYDGTRLACGARTWIETYGDVELIDEMSFTEAKEAA